jgi:hypothetical protein
MPRKPRGKPPWKRGPVAWKVAGNARAIRLKISSHPRRFHSLRAAASLFEISPQPFRDWISRGFLPLSGPRQKISASALLELLNSFEENAQPLGPDFYLKRLLKKRRWLPLPYSKLRSARFLWPKKRSSLTPRELAILIGCHPSLIRKAIAAHEVRGSGRTPYRWEITRYAWNLAFPLTVIRSCELPPIPNGDPLPVGVVSKYLRACGLPKVRAVAVKRLVEHSYLESTRNEGRRCLLISRRSVKKLHRFLKTASAAEKNLLTQIDKP